MTTPSYVGRQTGGTLSGSSPSIISVSAWSGLASGDLLLAFATDTDPGSAVATPTGWLLLGKLAHPSGALVSYLWGRIIGSPAAEPDLVLNWRVAYYGPRLVEVQAWRDGDPSVILDAAVSSAMVTGKTITTPEVSTAGDGARVVHLVACADANRAYTIAGSSPFDTQVDVETYFGSGTLYARQRAFSIVKSPPGATGSASAVHGSTTGTNFVGFLVALKPGPPRGAATVPATVTATQDAVQADTGIAAAPTTAGATAAWTYLDGVGEGTLLSPATLGASQDAAQSDAGESTAGATLGASASVVQAEVGEGAAPATLGASHAATHQDLGGDGEAVTLATAPDASYVPQGVVVYPDGESWQATLAGLGPAQTQVTITDNLGAVIVIHLDGSGIVPEPDNALVVLGATAEPGYWTPGEDDARVTFGAAHAAHQADVGELAAAVTFGADLDAEAMPPLVPRWLAKAIRVAQSWVGGPYRRVPLDQFGWEPEERISFAGSQDGNFTPLHATADIPIAAIVVVASHDATFTIVEPKVTVRVPALRYGVAVPALHRGQRVASIPWHAHAADPHRLGVAVPAHPLNVLVPARRRQ